MVVMILSVINKRPATHAAWVGLCIVIPIQTGDRKVVKPVVSQVGLQADRSRPNQRFGRGAKVAPTGRE